ncbi:MAG: single-stranded DNA-binding protein [Clostridiales bacterium]|jgi:single-strand DNA-binding protein|nr:single-stranded DNA-binding protein [Clostridiales bacterium]
MANFNFNKVIIGGRLTADPELKTTSSGVSVTSFSVAVNRRFQAKNAEDTQTDFFNVTAWRQTAEFVTQYFHKASSICVVGTLQNRSWIDNNNVKQYRTEIVADEVFFVDSKGESAPVFPVQPPAAVPVSKSEMDAQFADAQSSFAKINDDDFPF